MPRHAENLVGCLLHDLGAWIVVFVHTMTKAHQTERIVLVLGTRDELWNTVNGVPISFSMVKAASLAPPWAGPHKAGDAGRDTGKWIGA